MSVFVMIKHIESPVTGFPVSVVMVTTEADDLVSWAGPYTRHAGVRKAARHIMQQTDGTLLRLYGPDDLVTAQRVEMR